MCIHIHILGGATLHLPAGSDIPGQLTELPVHFATAESGRTRPVPATAFAMSEPPAPGEVWPGQGGRFVCTMPALLGQPAYHLVAAMEDAPSKLAWGPYADLDGCGSHVDGAANSTRLVTDGADYPAADWCFAHRADGHADFYLPSRMELLFAWLHAPQMFVKDGWYWSSTQFSRGSAFVQIFESGISDWYSKDYEYRVRAFRRILKPLSA